ncbi:MAG: universal stress protein [Bacteroidia bacterium]|nr:MAG: universal stress protein [Bacteroidia bacterium]
MQASKILVTTDLTGISDIATEYAADLAIQLKTKEIVLLNLLIPSHIQIAAASGGAHCPPCHVTHKLNDVLFEKRKTLLEKQAVKCSRPGVTLKPVVVVNHNKSDINHFMKEFNANLLITGSRDKYSFMEILLGSEKEKMIRQVNNPMIVLTDEPISTSVNNILLAIDLELDDKQQKGIESVTKFAGLLNAHLQLLYVITNGNISSTSAIERLHQLAKDRNIRNYSINTMENPSLDSAIRNFSRMYKPDMIALLTQGKGKLHNLIYGSNTREVINETNMPVYVARSI